jgi:hypothetical protein
MTQQRLKEIFTYDELTGLFNRVTGRNKVGTTDYNGYITISIDYNRYQAHRLAWLYMYGRLPTTQLDHIDHNRSNNAISNLREVSISENSKSKRLYKANKSGHHGVIWDPCNNNWRARIGVNGKTINLGSFKNKDDAIAARKAGEHEYEYHENHGIGNVGDHGKY